jgi:seryl-tRNA synthetase
MICPKGIEKPQRADSQSALKDSRRATANSVLDTRSWIQIRSKEEAMIDIELIRREPDRVRTALLKRMDHVNLEEILELDESRRRQIGELDQKRSERKSTAKRIGQLRAAGEDSTAAEEAAGRLKQELAELESALSKTESRLQTIMDSLPNIPDDRVPAGGKESNQVVRTWGEAPTLPSSAPDHVEVCTRLGLVDFERGVKLGGSGFWLYTGLGARLEWALLDWFVREHLNSGYEFFLPPHLLTEECGYAAGQFPKFRDDVFHIQTTGNERDRFLLPTAETAIINIHREEIIDSNRLPLKYFAYSPCYRREAGSYRTEERGTVRGHQFNKVEMFQFVKPEDSDVALEELVRKAETLVEKLGLHYQTSLLAAQDASAGMAMTYDVEVWIPSMATFKEVSSVSNAKCFQARRGGIRFRSEGKKETAFVHTLNGSGLATSRVIPAIVEQFLQPDGSVIVPEVLRDALGTDVLRTK